MPQGNLRVKANIPVGAKVKQRTIAKAKDFQKKNRPAPRKSNNLVSSSITKAINEANETTVREKAVYDGKIMHVLPSDDVLPESSGSGSKVSKPKGKHSGAKGIKANASKMSKGK